MRTYCRSRRAAFAVAMALAITGAGASCVNPRSEAAVATALNDAANEISGLKNDIAMLQTQLDSMKTTLAHQDSLINRIAAVNNIPR